MILEANVCTEHDDEFIEEVRFHTNYCKEKGIVFQLVDVVNDNVVGRYTHKDKKVLVAFMFQIGVISYTEIKLDNRGKEVSRVFDIM